MNYRIFPGISATTEDIVKNIYSYYKLDHKEFKKKSIRKTEYNNAKQIVLYTLFKHYKLNSMSIERLYGIDHSTTLNAKKNISGLLDVDKKFVTEYNTILERLEKLNIKSLAHLNRLTYGK